MDRTRKDSEINSKRKGSSSKNEVRKSNFWRKKNLNLLIKINHFTKKTADDYKGFLDNYMGISNDMIGGIFFVSQYEETIVYFKWEKSRERVTKNSVNLNKII